MTNRKAEATATVKSIRDNSHMSNDGKKLLGTADWYVVRTKGDRVTVLREQDIKKTDSKLGGPYYTKAQAIDEKPSQPKKEKIAKKMAKKVNGKVHRIDQSKTIVRLVKENPRQKGTFGWKSFAKIQPKMTVEKFVEAGGRLVDLRWDIAHKFVTLK